MQERGLVSVACSHWELSLSPSTGENLIGISGMAFIKDFLD